MVDPHTKAEKAGGYRGEHNCEIAESPTAGKCGYQRRHDTRSRQEDDVDLWVAEEPEQMLVEKGIASLGGVEELRAEVAIEQQHEAGQNHRRQGKDNGKGHNR